MKQKTDKNTLKTLKHKGATEMSDNFSYVRNKATAEFCSPRY